MARKVKAARTVAVPRGRGAAFKAQVALAPCKGDKTLGELAGQFDGNRSQSHATPLLVLRLNERLRQ